MRRTVFLGILLSGLVFFAAAETAQAQFWRGGGQWAGGFYGPTYYSSPTWYGGPSYYGRSTFYPSYGTPYNYGGWYAPSYSRSGYYNTYPTYPTWSGTSSWYPSYGNVYYTRPLSYPTAVAAANVTATASPAGYQSYYAGPNVDADKVRVRVFVPTDNARVVIDDYQSQQTGTERTFISPSIQPGSYTYTIRATWKDGDREMTRLKQVNVQPGQETIVRFTAADADTSSQPAVDTAAPTRSQGP